jgi:hypothetical protein
MRVSEAPCCTLQQCSQTRGQPSRTKGAIKPCIGGRGAGHPITLETIVSYDQVDGVSQNIRVFYYYKTLDLLSLNAKSISRPPYLLRSIELACPLLNVKQEITLVFGVPVGDEICCSHVPIVVAFDWVSREEMDTVSFHQRRKRKSTTFGRWSHR